MSDLAKAVPWFPVPPVGVSISHIDEFGPVWSDGIRREQRPATAENAGPAPAYLRAKDALHEAGWSLEDDWFTFEQSQIHQDDVRRIVAAATGESHE